MPPRREPARGDNGGELPGGDHFKKEDVTKEGSGKVERTALSRAEKEGFKRDLIASRVGKFISGV